MGITEIIKRRDTTEKVVKMFIRRLKMADVAKGVEGFWYTATFTDNHKHYRIKIDMKHWDSCIDITLYSDISCLSEETSSLAQQYIGRIVDDFPFRIAIDQRTKVVYASARLHTAERPLTVDKLVNCVCEITVMFDSYYRPIKKLAGGVLPQAEEFDPVEMLRKSIKETVSHIFEADETLAEKLEEIDGASETDESSCSVTISDMLKRVTDRASDRFDDDDEDYSTRYIIDDAFDEDDDDDDDDEFIPDTAGRMNKILIDELAQLTAEKQRPEEETDEDNEE